MKKILTTFIIMVTLTMTQAQVSSKKYLSKEQTANDQLVGVWSLVAVENINPDNSKTLPYGTDPKGMLVFDINGNYAIQIVKASRPKVAANDKNKATSEENAALVQGNNSHFGKYKVDPLKHMITFQIEHAFYPNWEGTTQERSYTLIGNELKYIVTQTTNGGAVTAVVIWKRTQ